MLVQTENAAACLLNVADITEVTQCHGTCERARRVAFVGGLVVHLFDGGQDALRVRVVVRRAAHADHCRELGGICLRLREYMQAMWEWEGGNTGARQNEI